MYNYTYTHHHICTYAHISPQYVMGYLKRKSPSLRALLRTLKPHQTGASFSLMGSISVPVDLQTKAMLSQVFDTEAKLLVLNVKWLIISLGFVYYRNII